MIRPFTCLTFLLACGSGLYLYQTKHRVKVLDDQIAQVVKSTDTMREQTRMLSAEWTLLNDPERLRQLATQFLTLQTVSPNQFTSLADLDSRLPAPLPQGASPPAGAAAPAVAQQTPAPTVAADATAVQTAAPPAAVKLDDPHPSAAAPTVAIAAAVATPDAALPRTAVMAPADATHATIAPADASHATDHRATPHIVAIEQHPPVARNDVRHPVAPSDVAQRSFVPRMEQRPVMAARTLVPVPLPGAGSSLLGMAHDTPAPPLPRPMPVSAPLTSYNYPGG